MLLVELIKLIEVLQELLFNVLRKPWLEKSSVMPITSKFSFHEKSKKERFLNLAVF